MTKKHMVTKDNDLVGASYSLGVSEQRLIFLAIIEAREQHKLIDAMGLLRISAKSYQKHFCVSRQTAYEALRTAVTGLFYAELEYSQVDEISGKRAHHKRRWVEHIVYIDDVACVELQFTSSIIPLITRLDERYTEYELKQVSELQSEYSIRLYELLIQNRSIGKTKVIPLAELRSKLGVNSEQYGVMSDFKKRVLDHAIQQISAFTDIDATYKQQKEGRRITGFIFTFKTKTKPKKVSNTKKNSDPLDMSAPLKMNDKQRGTFAAKLAQMNELSDRAKQGEDYKQFAARIELDLLDESKQEFYFPFLKKLGFQQS